jgi:hypothetical protein
MRDRILQRFHSHYDDFKNGMFEYPHTQTAIGLSIWMSKIDLECGGNLMPYYYIEFEVPGARPVDVFNVLADVADQSTWLCDACTSDILKNNLQEKVQGLQNSIKTPVVGWHQFYEWIAYEANFETEDFLLGVVGDQLGNLSLEELHEIQPPMQGAANAPMCFSFSHITRIPGGSHVVQMTHFNPSMPPIPFITPRTIFPFVWPMVVQRVPKIMARAKWQAARNWNDTQLTVPVELVQERYSEVAASFAASGFSPESPSIAAATNLGEGRDDSAYVFWIGVVVLCCSCVTCVYCCCCSRRAKKDCDDRCWSPVADAEYGSRNTSRDDEDDEPQSPRSVKSTLSAESSARDCGMWLRKPSDDTLE